jgi:hypothetical protein
MSKKNQVTIKMDIRSAAAVRQILFDAQKGYTYNQAYVPPRINDIREVICDLDDKIACAIDPE